METTYKLTKMQGLAMRGVELEYDATMRAAIEMRKEADKLRDESLSAILAEHGDSWDSNQRDIRALKVKRDPKTLLPIELTYDDGEGTGDQSPVEEAAPEVGVSESTDEPVTETAGVTSAT